jgi:hypothetical protein
MDTQFVQHATTKYRTIIIYIIIYSVLLKTRKDGQSLSSVYKTYKNVLFETTAVMQMHVSLTFKS